MNILYIYGWNSSPNSNTLNILKVLLPQHNIISINYDQLCPQLAIDKFTQFITDNNINAIIASSFGAFIALHIPHSIYKFLINPCFYPSQEVPKLNKNLSANFINQCKTIENTQTPVDNESILFTFAFFSTHDQLFSYKNTYLEQGYTKTITLPNESHTPTPKGLEIVANTINSQLLG